MDDALRRGMPGDLSRQMEVEARRLAKKARDEQRRANYRPNPQRTDEVKKADREARLDRWAQYNQAIREHHRDDAARKATKAPKDRGRRQARNKAASHSRSRNR